MSWIVSGVSAVVAIGSSMKASDAGKEGAHDAKMAIKSATYKSKGEINRAYDLAGNLTKEGAAKAQEYQDPYLDTGKKAKSWFDNTYNDAGKMSGLYNQYSKLGDPLYDYWQAKQEKSLNRRLASIGKFGSGAGTAAHTEQNSNLSANMATLTDTRVAREISTQMQLLGAGQSAANVSTNLQYNLGNRLGDLEVGRGSAIANLTMGQGVTYAQAANANAAADANMWGQIGSTAGTFAGAAMYKGFGLGNKTTVPTGQSTTVPPTTTTPPNTFNKVPEIVRGGSGGMGDNGIDYSLGTGWVPGENFDTSGRYNTPYEPIEQWGGGGKYINRSGSSIRRY